MEKIRYMSKRSRLDIYFDILKVVERGFTKPTEIIYKAYLSWQILNEAFLILVTKGFIHEELLKNSKRYCITDKGHNALFYRRKSLEGLVEKISLPNDSKGITNEGSTLSDNIRRRTLNYM
jgi:predicted transcriptional regulator